MKHLSLLLFATLFAVALPTTPARAEVDVSIDFFFDALSPHGDWIYADDYGYVWEPAVARQADWAPYSDGYWAYTDAGWTWISNENFGWATYHYGRWLRMHNHWVWIPGNEWAPAWVSWRQTDDYVGWAPLPPEARWSISIGFNRWTDSYYDIGPSYYSFVPIHSFARRSSLRPFIMDRRSNVTYINRSVNITNITYRQNVVNNIFVGGPDPDRYDRLGKNQVRRLTLRRDEDTFRRDWLNNRGDRPKDFGSLSRIERDQLVIAAPTIKREDAPRLPSRVRERFERPEVDRGWRDVGDSKAADRLRESQRAAFAKAKPAELPDKKPQLITSKVPPPAVGRLLKTEERRGSVQRPDPRKVEEEVRKATPTTKGKDKPGNKPMVKDQPPSPTEGRPGMRPEGRPSKTEDLPPKSKADSKKDAPPAGRKPEMPSQREDKPKGLPETRRPAIPESKPDTSKMRPSPESKPDVKVRPMPSPERKPEAKARPMPTPERKPEAKVRPMPTPERKPEAKARPEPTQERNPMTKAKPKAPEPRPTPQVKKPTPKPQVKQAPPKAKPTPTAPQRKSSAKGKKDEESDTRRKR